MLEKCQMYLIGCALSQTVRYYLPFSENLPDFHLNKFPDSLFLKERTASMLQLRAMDFRSYSREYGLSALNAGVGYCGELAIFTGCLSEHLRDLPSDENIYLSILRIGKRDLWAKYSKGGPHIFLILHQNDNWHRKYTPDRAELLADDFRDLPECLPPNSVIVDPWIRTVSCLSDVEMHLQKAAKYGVSDYYAENKKIKMHNASFKVGSKQNEPVPTSLRDVLWIYEACFKSLQSENSYPCRGPRFKETCNYFRKKISSWDSETERLQSLRNLFSAIGNKQSCYLPMSFDYKSASFHKAIFYLDACKRMAQFPLDKFAKLLFAVLRMTVLVRYKQAPVILKGNNLLRTKTGSALFDNAIINDTPYTFEQWPGMSLDWVRNFVLSSADESVRYEMLCLYLHRENIEEFIESGEYSNASAQTGMICLPQGYQKYKELRKDLSCLYMSNYHQYCSAQLDEIMRIRGDGMVDHVRFDNRNARLSDDDNANTLII